MTYDYSAGPSGPAFLFRGLAGGREPRASWAVVRRAPRRPSSRLGQLYRPSTERRRPRASATSRRAEPESRPCTRRTLIASLAVVRSLNVFRLGVLGSECRSRPALSHARRTWGEGRSGPPRKWRVGFRRASRNARARGAPRPSPARAAKPPLVSAAGVRSSASELKDAASWRC